MEDVERKIKRAIRKCKMIRKDNRILIALSGGKDSMMLLHTLYSIFEGRKDLEMIAVTVDEGISDYREHTVKIASDACKSLDIEHHIITFKDTFHTTVDNVASKEMEQAPCTFCGAMRKASLNRAAKDLDADKIAIGHNLDDLAQTILMNYLRGDIERLARLIPSRVQPGLIPRIKPLMDVPEKETALYVTLQGFELSTDECPYASQSLRWEIRDMLNDYENNHPGAKYSLVRGFETMRETLTSLYPPADLSICQNCGEPCINSTCKTCELLDMVREK